MASSEVPVCARAEAALAKYSKGVIRIDVDQIGAHWLNRNGLPVSGKHVHHLWRTILQRHGFVRHRYNHAVVVEMPEGDLQRLREHNQQFCEKDPLLPKASPNMKYGCLTKTHLIYGLKCFKHGSMRWDDTGEVMTVPKNAETVKEHIENGVFAMVISKEAFLDNPDHLISIMVSGNLEQSVAMPEHEIALLQSVMSLVDKPVPQGEVPAEYIGKTLQPLTGGRWDDDDIRQIWNFAMVAGVEQAKLLMHVHFQHINPAIVVVKPSFFGICSQIPKEFRWCRMTIVVAQYLLVGDSGGFERTGRVLVASGIKETAVKRIAKDTDLHAAMSTIETFISDCLCRYDHAHLQNELPVSSHLSAVSGLLARVGRLLTCNLDTGNKWKTKLVNAEVLFRKALQDAGGVLPEPVFEGVSAAMTLKETQKEQKTNRTASGDDNVAAPAEEPEETGERLVQHGLEPPDRKKKMLTSKRNLEIGCKAELTKRFKGRASGQKGVVEAIDSEKEMISVMWEDPPGMLIVPLHLCRFTPSMDARDGSDLSKGAGPKSPASPCPENSQEEGDNMCGLGTEKVETNNGLSETHEPREVPISAKCPLQDKATGMVQDVAEPGLSAAVPSGRNPVGAFNMPSNIGQGGRSEVDEPSGSMVSAKRRRTETLAPEGGTEGGSAVWESIQWKMFSDNQAISALRAQVEMGLFRALCWQGHDSNHLSVEIYNTLPSRVCSRQRFKKSELLLVPYSPIVLQASPAGPQAQVHVQNGGDEKPDLVFMCGISARTSDSVIPYWYVRETENPAEVNLVRTTATFNLGSWQLLGEEYDWNIYDDAGHLEFEAFINDKVVKPGDELVVLAKTL